MINVSYIVPNWWNTFLFWYLDRSHLIHCSLTFYPLLGYGKIRSLLSLDIMSCLGIPRLINLQWKIESLVFPWQSFLNQCWFNCKGPTAGFKLVVLSPYNTIAIRSHIWTKHDWLHNVNMNNMFRDCNIRCQVSHVYIQSV